ncbi:MAG: two-component system, OmpR family, response regulator MprA [Solirubrobacteraceae bacterium]|jgi:two-component system response regulator MprA|nr:two-component system, OmpR family, response regulator MprA [Solirubrobacteraceae bacterium]
MRPAVADRAADVLVVENDAVPREGLRNVLEADGCEVRVAGDAERVLPLLERDGAPDLIVLDAPLPTRGVLELCRRLRRRYADLLLVLICEADAIEDRVAGLRAGADEYVGKPFAPEEVAARVHALLRRAGRRALGAVVLRHGAIRLDGAARRASRGDEGLDLTRTEFDLLALFLRHPGEVLERSFIYERVWGHAAEYASNSLEVYVSSLRRKLERRSAARVIRTVRGVGYVLGEA